MKKSRPPTQPLPTIPLGCRTRYKLRCRSLVRRIRLCQERDESMRYGKLAENRNINAMIYQCFNQLEERDARLFARKFRDQRDDAHQVMHTFRELLAGAFIAQQGFRPEYEPKIDNQTPDWRFASSEDGLS